jgi:hypothetical protein
MQQWRLLALALAGILGTSSCRTHESDAERRRDANTPAGKLGQAAHKAAVQADKAGRAIGKKLDKAAHDAREGWNEDARQNRNTK